MRNQHRAMLKLVMGVLMTSTAIPVMAAEHEGEDHPWPSDDLIIITGAHASVEDVPGSASFIGLEELQKQDYSDINRVLRAVPGVNIQEEDGFGLRPNIGIRGTGLDRSAKITLMEDSVLIAPAPYAAPSAYYFPSAGRMSGVEVIKGAAGIKYGPRTQGGSVNLLSTAVPGTFGALADLRLGDFNTRRAHIWAGGPVREKGVRISLLGEGFFNSSDGFKRLDNGGNTGFDIQDYVVKLRLQSPSNTAHQQSLEFKAQYSDQTSDETYLGLTDTDFAATPFRRYSGSSLDEFTGEHSLFSARWQGDLGKGFTSTVLAYRTDFSRDWFKLDRVDIAGTVSNGGKSGIGISSILANPDRYGDELAILKGENGLVSADGALLIKHNNRDYYAQGLQGAMAWNGDLGKANHTIEASARYHEDQQDRFQWWDRYKSDAGTLVRTGVDAAGTESNRIDSARALALYVQDTAIIGRWTLVPGARFESVDLQRRDYGKADPDRLGGAMKQTDNTVSAFIPGLGIIYDVNDHYALFGGVHEGFSPPSPGRQNARAETATNWELGSRWHRDGYLVELTGFYNAFSNMVGTVTASTGGNAAIGDQFNGGKVDVKGVEATASMDLAALLNTPFNMPLRFAYTYTDASFKTSFQSGFEPWGAVTAGDKVPYIPRHQGSAALGLEGTHFGGELSLSYVSAVRTQAGQGPIPTSSRIQSHVVADLSTYWQVQDRVRVSASVRNLFDTRYAVARRPAGLRPGLPRMALIGLTLSY